MKIGIAEATSKKSEDEGLREFVIKLLFEPYETNENVLYAGFAVKKDASPTVVLRELHYAVGQLRKEVDKRYA